MKAILVFVLGTGIILMWTVILSKYFNKKRKTTKNPEIKPKFRRYLLASGGVMGVRIKE